MTAGDVETIAQLVLHERQGRDRGWWDRMRDSYWPDATVHLSWFSGDAHAFVDASAAMAGRGDQAAHRLSPVVVDIVGDRALAEAPAAIEVATVVDGIPAVLVSYTRIEYRALRRDGEWRLFGLDTVYERDALVPSIPGTIVSVDPAELAAFRPPYALLAHALSSRGYAIGDDLLGDDRPDEVAAFYARERAWLAGG
jgi:hypothetical protein